MPNNPEENSPVSSLDALQQTSRFALENLSRDQIEKHGLCKAQHSTLTNEAVHDLTGTQAAGMVTKLFLLLITAVPGTLHFIASLALQVSRQKEYEEKG